MRYPTKVGPAFCLQKFCLSLPFCTLLCALVSDMWPLWHWNLGPSAYRPDVLYCLAIRHDTVLACSFLKRFVMNLCPIPGLPERFIFKLLHPSSRDSGHLHWPPSTTWWEKKCTHGGRNPGPADYRFHVLSTGLAGRLSPINRGADHGPILQ